MINVFILCVVQSIVLEVLLMLLEKRLLGAKYILKPLTMVEDFLGGIVVFYIFLSMIRTLTGKAMLTLSECFADAPKNTGRHYLLITGVFVLFCVVVCRLFLFSERKNSIFGEWKERFWGILFLGFGISYLFSFSLHNAYILSVAFLSAIVSAISTYIHRTNRGNSEGENIDIPYVDRVKYLLPAATLYFLLDWVLIPSEVYFGNISEMKISLANWTRGTVLPFLIFLIGYVLVWSLFFKESITLKTGYYVLVWMGLSEYIQYMFLNGKMHFLDGTEQVWEHNVLVYNLLIWGIIGALVLAIAIIEGRRKRRSHLAVWTFTGMLLITTVTLFATRANTVEKRNGFGSEGMLELSTNKNVIYFVLDAFDGAYMSYLLEQEEELKQVFKDFTYYDNATSRYALTGTGLPYLLTGVENEGMMSEAEYINYAYSKGAFLPSIADANFDIRIYSDEGYFPDSILGIVNNYGEEVEQNLDSVENIDLIRKISKYSSMPFAVKQKYKWGSWDIQNLISKYGYDPWNDRAIYHEICDYGLTTNEAYGTGVFRFFHLQGAHLPYVMNEKCEFDTQATRYQQCRGVLTIVESYLKEMKKLGVYDDSLIVITADHGGGGVSNVGKLQDISHPILLVKQEGENGEAMRTSTNAVTQGDLFKSVIWYVDSSNSSFTDFSSLEDTFADDRVRKFTVMYPDYGMTNYVISGDVHLPESWKLESYLPNG